MTTMRLDHLLARGQEAFATGRFFEAQQVWEAAAREAGVLLRGWVQALATLSGGMVAAEEHRLATAERLLARGVGALVHAPAAIVTVDVDTARAAADAYLVALRGERQPMGHEPVWLEPAARPAVARAVERSA